jgi:hypothetical protein
MRRYAHYSPEKKSWVIPSWDTKIIALEHLVPLPAPDYSFEDFLFEGIQRGLWDVNVDEETRLDVIVIK